MLFRDAFWRCVVQVLYWFDMKGSLVLERKFTDAYQVLLVCCVFCYQPLFSFLPNIFLSLLSLSLSLYLPNYLFLQMGHG